MTQGGNVVFCPVTRETWEERAKAKSGDCGGQSVYHCLSDNEGRKWERCVEKSLVKEGFCPIFTNKGFIDWKLCNKSISTCPSISYFSDDVYKFPRCFGNNSLHNQTGVNLENAERIPVAVVIGTVFVLLVLAAILTLTFWFIYKRRRNLNSYSKENVESKILLPGRMSYKFVKEQNVINGTALLLRDEVRSIVVVGKYGNSVSSTSRRISETIKKMMDWISLECRYTDIPISVDEKTIMYIYGWFGLWNDDFCSVNKANNACQSLIQILNETRNVKLILGMRSDLYKKYHQELNKADYQKTSLFHYQINLDSGADVCKDKEYSNHFNEKIKKQCKRRDCVCKNLKYDMLRQGEDKVVGMPLKISVIKTYHELIPQYLDNWDILRVMIDHFTAIENDRERRYVYEWIMYICLKGKFSRTDPYDTNLVKEMSFKIEQSSFDEKDKELCRYIRIRNSDKLRNVSPENAQFVFWHPFIYICAFHFMFQKDPEFIMKHCNVDAILQIVRPRGFKTSYFEVAANDKCVTLFQKRIHQFGKEEEYANNPLVAKGTGTEEAESSQIQLNIDHGS